MNLIFTLKQNVKFTLPADLSYSSFVRHVAQEVFVYAKFSKSWASRLKLVVDELFMNAVKYGSTVEKSELRISFEFDAASLRFTIEDDGTGEKAVPPEELQKIIETNKANKDLTRTSGRGLSMITQQWTDSMQVQASELGGISVSFSKTIQSDEAPTPKPMPGGLIDQAVAAASAPAAPTPQVQAPTPAQPSASDAPAPSKVYEVKLSGEIDQSNIQEVTAPVTDQVHAMEANAVLNLDFTDVKYINSTFIGSLASWHTTLQQKGGDIHLKNMSEPIKEILQLVGLLHVIPHD